MPRPTTMIRPIPPNAEIVVYCPELILRYDPTRDSGTVTFRTQETIEVNGVSDGSKLGALGTFSKNTDDILADLFPEAGLDPITGADLTQVSGAGMMVLLKRAFEKYYDDNTATE